MNEPIPTRPPDEKQDLGSTRAEGASTQPSTAQTPFLRGDTPTPNLGLPEKFGRYRILARLGAGGMGTVYKAHDPQLDLIVSLKVPHPHIAQDADALERFYREARSAARLDHRNICRVFDVGEFDGLHYMTMKYIEGQPLASVLVDFAEPGRATTLVRKIALAMAVAHAKGVIHRDLKPANVMIDLEGEPVVMDFGLARRVDVEAATRTSQGVIMGTPLYMSPEQATGDMAAIGPTSDVYSLGVIFYELLAGRVPFQGAITSVLVQIVHNEPEPPSAYRTGLDARVQAICQKAIAKQQVNRYASMTLFAVALEAYASGGPAAQAEPVPAATQNSIIAGLAQEALALLRTWGWQRGSAILRERAAGNVDAGRLLAWLDGAEDPAATQAQLCAAGSVPADLVAWAALGRVYRALTSYEHGAVPALLDRTAALQRDGGPEALADSVLEANICHIRGFLLFRRGQWEQALPMLHRALGLLGRDHFLTGRLLDTLGEVYAGRNNYHAAQEFHQLAIECKERFSDESGIGFSRCRLGRLCLEWGLLDQAEEYFNADLQLVQRTGERDVEAQLLQYLAQVALARAVLDQAAGRRGAADRQLAQAAEWIDWSIEQHRQDSRPVLEGLACKDRAELCLAQGDRDGAEVRMKRADDLLRPANYTKGLADMWRVQGILRRGQGRHAEALKALQQALAEFDATRQQAAAARTQLEVARTLQASKAMQRVVTQAFLDALQRAETCRRTDLVRTVEEELKTTDPEAYARHVFRRVRGPMASADTTSLASGSVEQASVLFLNLQGFMPFCQGMDPEEVLVTLNQMMSDLETELLRYKAQVTAYLGGGFMALVLGAGHADRAVDAALDLFRVIEQFNRPREVLGLRLLPVRISIASGPVFLGNIGTYRKMDFTAVGQPVNLASRLVRYGEDKSPCVSQETYELVQSRFVFKADGPRTVELKGIGKRQVWDVIGRTKERTSGVSRG